MDTLEAIRGYLPLSDTLATAGQPTPAQLEAVRTTGYDVVINLAPLDESAALANEPALVARLGMRYVGIPVVWAAPQPDDARSFFAHLEQHAGERVFVHCIANMRVSAFIYLYRVARLGWAPADAAVDLHRIWRPNALWQRFINEMLVEGPA